jgi:hypothetical protein
MPDSSEQADKVQIGLTPAASEKLDAIMERGWFSEKQDVYRLAVGVALAKNIVATQQDIVGAITRYSFAGGLDRESQVRTLISEMAPQAERNRPAAYAERLAHAGITYLYDRLVTAEATLAETLTEVSRSAETPVHSAPT